MKTRSKIVALLVGSSVALGAAFGCAMDAGCDPDQVYRNGMCLAKGSGKAPATSTTAAADAGPPGEGGAVDLTCGPGSAATGTFGADCKVDADCGCPAPVCAIQSTDTLGFCTQIGCVDNPSACPAGWHCFDASVLNPDYPQLCVKG